jgi:hypothetical protein
VTIVIGKLVKVGCILGSDSKITDGVVSYPARGGKMVDLAPGIVAAWAGPALMRDALRVAARRARRRDQLGVDRLLDALRIRLTQIRWEPLMQDEEGHDSSPDWGMEILLTDGRRLIEVCSGLGAEDGEPDRFACIGSGYECGAAAIHAAAGILGEPAPDLVVRTAVEAVTATHSQCGPPVVVRRVSPSKAVRLTW